MAYFILVCRLRTSSLERSFPDRSDSRVSKSESTSATVRVLPLTFIWFSKRVMSLFNWVISVTSLSSGHATSVLNSCKSFMVTFIFESLYREYTLKILNRTLQVPVSNQGMGSLDRSYFVKAHRHFFQAQELRRHRRCIVQGEFWHMPCEHIAMLAWWGTVQHKILASFKSPQYARRNLEISEKSSSSHASHLANVLTSKSRHLCSNHSVSHQKPRL